MSESGKHRTALVTGGGSGIGQSICRRLARDGVRVLVLDISSEGASQTASSIGETGGDALPYSCDVADHEAVKHTVSGILAESPIDILVNNAGIGFVGNIENTSEDDLDRLYRVNVKGVYNVSAAVIPAMKERRQGVIVNMASIAATVGIEDRFAYSMTKGAVVSMTQSIARDYVSHGIRCNCVSPARVHTPFVDDYLARNYPGREQEMFEALSKTQPIGRMAHPDEVASLVAWLCSDDAAFVTGTDFPIDGGFIKIKTP